MRTSLTILAVLSLTTLSLASPAMAENDHQVFPFVDPGNSIIGFLAEELEGYDELMYYTEPASCSGSIVDTGAIIDAWYDGAIETLHVSTEAAFLGLWGTFCPDVDVTFSDCTSGLGASGSKVVECGNPAVRDDPYVFGDFASLVLNEAEDGGFLYFQQNVADPSLGYEVRRITGDIETAPASPLSLPI